jgi:hypothetical protein
MNTLKRILIIALAAILVAGATLTIAGWTGQSSPGETQFSQTDRPAFDSGSAPTRPEGGDRDEGGAGGWIEVVKNAGIFSALFGAAMGLNLAWNQLTKLRQRPPTAMAG